MVTKIKFILGNWKMHGSLAEAKALASALAAKPAVAGVEVAVFPPATALSTVKASLQGSHLTLGAQDCSAEAHGAFTGDISAAMLKDAGCIYVIVGHSERRTTHKESDALVKKKAEAALAQDLVPVICVGEDLAMRESGKYLDFIHSQLQHSLPSPEHSGSYIIAYEPVWAIGTGRTATTKEIEEVHKTIASQLDCATSGARTAIVYGGSVKADNARSILSTQGVDGVLVGGASLKAVEFSAIIDAAQV